jgi:signal transduction histidine kinase
VDGATSGLEPGLALTVYRVVQESLKLTNTLKHAGPATPTAAVVRQRPDAVQVRVAYEGPSAEARSTGSPVPASNGHGLVGMAERVAMYGGTLHGAPRAGGGWRVDVVVPTGRAVGDGHR